MEIGNHLLKTLALVADLQVEGILGLDMIKRFDMIIDTKHGVLSFQDERIPVLYEGKFGCFRVVAKETVSIPPRSELIVPGKMCTLDDRKLQSECIVESKEREDTNRPLTARTFVRPLENIVPVRLLNVDPEPKVVYKNTEIGQFQETDAVSSSDSCNLAERHDIEQLYQDSVKHLSKTQAKEVKAFLLQYTSLFAKSNNDLGKTNIVKHKIDTGDARPIKQPVRRAPAHLSKEIERNIEEMLEYNIFEPSISPWASPIVLVKKKDNSYRFCVDYRRLNASTVKDAYPLPRIDESLEQLSGYSWFSTLDMFSGYWQVELDPADKNKTAFATRRGLFQFRVMPFGLCCAPATFERLMETVLAGLQWDICLVYLDDIIIMGKTFDEMMVNLGRVFDRLLSAGLRLKAKKCHLFQRSVKFLGHVISEEGITTDPEKIESVRNWPVPSNTSEIRSFLGLCGYYRKFIKDFSKIAKCLHKLTEKGRPFVWDNDCQVAFDLLKHKLTTSPVLVILTLVKSLYWIPMLAGMQSGLYFLKNKMVTRK